MRKFLLIEEDLTFLQHSQVFNVARLGYSFVFKYWFNQYEIKQVISCLDSKQLSKMSLLFDFLIEGYQYQWFYVIVQTLYLLLNSLQLSMNYKQSELKSKLIREAVGDTVLYYSLVKKQGKNLTFLSNDRLLIYDSNRRTIFYNNDYSKTPFRTLVPEPKNNVFTPIASSTFSNPNSTNNILVRCTNKNQKGELQTIEWTFTCDSKTLTTEWMKLLQDEKNKIIQNRTGEKNAGFIHDTLIQAMKVNRTEQPLRETILKPEEQVIKPIPVPENSELRNSRLTEPRKSQILASNVQPVNTSQSNIRNSQNRPIDQSRKQNLGSSSIVKPRQSNINPRPAEESIINSNLRSSYNKPPDSLNQSKQQKNGADWNLKFLKLPTEATIYEFQQAATNALMSVWQKDSGSLNSRRDYEAQDLKVTVANCFTKEATLLKRQFRNYHFILQACKNKIVVGVPLSCLIQWQGVVALVKAPIPLQAEEVRFSKVSSQVRELQRYTRVSNSVLEKAILWDLTDIYGLNNDKRFIYVDGLVEYLPIHPDQSLLGTSLRPQYLLDTVDHVIPGGDVKTSNRQQQKSLASALEGISGCVKQLTQFLSSQELLWADALELKEIFHSFGVNFKFLPQVYEAVGNKNVRKYMQSVMTAKVAKDLAYSSILEGRRQNRKVSSQRIVQDYIRLLMEGNNHNSSQAWKQLNVCFKKQFSSPISNSQIIPGFFLNSLLKLLRVRVDISKLNKAKKAFKDQGIIGVGFVTDFDPKIKSYYRYTTQFIEKVRYACRQQKKDEKIHEQIVNELQLSSKKIPPQYTLNNNDQAILEYLSYYTPPSEFQSSPPLKHIKIYQALLEEPPTAFSLRITKAYLTWAVKKERNDQFKQFIEEALRISDYWLDDGHLYQADLIELLSNFYAAQGNTEQSLNYLKEALSKTIKSCGSQSRQAGSRYYELGQRQLKAGSKKEAMDSFSKAKTNMLANKSTSINYPLLLMRTASLELNNGNMEACVETSLDAIKNFDEYDKRTGSPVLTEGYKIKTFQILARAYEINNRKAQLRSMASICAKKFNSCIMDWTFQQMLRICLGAACYTHTSQQCQQFYQLCLQLNKEEDPLEPNQAIKKLMGLAQSMIVMEKFLTRFDYVDRIIAEQSSKKAISQDTRDFLLISRCLTAVVSQDYIEGLIQQKQYE